MFKLDDGCYCGNISYAAELMNLPDSYTPRACDCDFCTAHGASYISDNKGKLSFHIKSEQELSQFKQGSGLVDFLICRNCGVVVGAVYEEDKMLYGAINSKTVKGKMAFGETIIASPKKLGDADKVQRWKALWFSNVELSYGDA